MDKGDTINAVAIAGIPDPVRDWIFEADDKAGTKKASVVIGTEKRV